MSTDNEIILKFMETSIDKINRALANIYAIQQVLIKKGLVTQQELVLEISDAKTWPDRKVGIIVLNEMMKSLKEENKEKI
jgi:hypothetical protein